MKITGRVWKFGDHVNTDAMIPGKALRLPPAEAVKFVFEGLRPGWVNEVRQGDIIVAGRNFGMGSGRPGAVMFQRLGIAAVVAESVNSLFARNSINSGFLALGAPGIQMICEEGDTIVVDVVDGEASNVASGSSVSCETLPAPLLDIVRAGGLLAILRKEGYIE